MGLYELFLLTICMDKVGSCVMYWHTYGFRVKWTCGDSPGKECFYDLFRIFMFIHLCFGVRCFHFPWHVECMLWFRWMYQHLCNYPLSELVLHVEKEHFYDFFLVIEMYVVVSWGKACLIVIGFLSWLCINMPKRALFLNELHIVCFTLCALRLCGEVRFLDFLFSWKICMYLLIHELKLSLCIAWDWNLKPWIRLWY